MAVAPIGGPVKRRAVIREWFHLALWPYYEPSSAFSDKREGHSPAISAGGEWQRLGAAARLEVFLGTNRISFP